MKRGRKPFSNTLEKMVMEWQNKDIVDIRMKSYLKSAKEALGNREFSHVCNSLGSIYLINRNFDQAQILFDKAGRYAGKEDNRMQYAVSLMNLGELRTQQGRTLEAEFDFMFCEMAFTEAERETIPLYGFLLEYWVELYISYGNIKKAEEYIDKIIARNEKHQQYHWDSLLPWLECLLPSLETKYKKKAKLLISKIAPKIVSKMVSPNSKVSAVGDKNLYSFQKHN